MAYSLDGVFGFDGMLSDAAWPAISDVARNNGYVLILARPGLPLFRQATLQPAWRDDFARWPSHDAPWRDSKMKIIADRFDTKYDPNDVTE